MATYNAGIVTAYGSAVQGGYTGTYEEFCIEQGNIATNAQRAENAADAAEEVAESLSGITTAKASDVGKALKAKAVSDGMVTEWEFGATGGGLTDTQKELIVTILRNALYTTDQSANIDELEDSFINIVAYITATIDLQGNTIYNDDSLDTLRQYLTVTATYEDETTQDITGYVLDGTLTVGTSIITVSYRECYATVSVPVSQAVTRYTITNNLTGVINSNTDTSIAEGNTYTGVLSAETSGYIPVGVTVTVGGTDVTSTVYDLSTHSITITDIQGDIVIVAHEEEDPYAPVFELTSPLILGDTTDPRINDVANNRIATGVTIKDNETWTMCIDFISKKDVDNNVGVVSIVTNDTRTKLTYSKPYWRLEWHNDKSGDTPDNNNNKFNGVNLIYVLTHEKDSTIANCYGIKEKAITNSHALNNDGQICIGSLSDIGTFNRFSLFKRILSSDEITAWIGA